MSKIILGSKEDLAKFCTNTIRDIRDAYNDYIDCIESHGAALKMEYGFSWKGKYEKHPTSVRRGSLIICVILYPIGYSKSSAEKAHLCQCYYSKAGRIKRINDSAYQLNIGERADRGMTFFFKRYTKRLVRMPAEIALKQRLSDIPLNAIVPKRIGSSFNKTYRGFPLYLVWIVILLLLLFVLRLLIPTGYHPSLK